MTDLKLDLVATIEARADDLSDWTRTIWDFAGQYNWLSTRTQVSCPR